MPFSVNSYSPPRICKLEPSCDDTNSGRLDFLNLWTYFSVFPSLTAVYNTPSSSPTTNPVFGLGSLTRSAYRASWPVKSANNSAAWRSLTRPDTGTGFLRAVKLFPDNAPLFARRLWMRWQPRPDCWYWRKVWPGLRQPILSAIKAFRCVSQILACLFW